MRQIVCQSGSLKVFSQNLKHLFSCSIYHNIPYKGVNVVYYITTALIRSIPSTILEPLRGLSPLSSARLAEKSGRKAEIGLPVDDIERHRRRGVEERVIPKRARSFQQCRFNIFEIKPPLYIIVPTAPDFAQSFARTLKQPFYNGLAGTVPAWFTNDNFR